jgi:DNA-binding beta-propeller fold protein YncE
LALLNASSLLLAFFFFFWTPMLLSLTTCCRRSRSCPLGTASSEEPEEALSSPPPCRPAWAFRTPPLPLAGGSGPESILSHLGPSARPLLSFLDSVEGAQLGAVCAELAEVTALHGARWGWHLAGVATTVAGCSHASWRGELAGAPRPAGHHDEGSGSSDGPALSGARFRQPRGLAAASSGELLLTDCASHTVRHISAQGQVSTLAGSAGESGSEDGAGPAARFRVPSGIALCPDGSALVADWGNHTIRRVSSEGLVSTVAGAAGQEGSADGPGAQARFSFPAGLALSSKGSLFIADANNHTIRCLSPDGTVRTVAGAAGQQGSEDGPGPAARFSRPRGLALAPDGRLFVSDSHNHTIRCISAAGVVSTLAGSAGQSGSADGLGAAARFKQPWGLALHPGGCLYAADILDNSIRCISAEGAVSTLAGSGEEVPGTGWQEGRAERGRGPAARFWRPTALALGPQGSIYATHEHAVRRLR